MRVSQPGVRVAAIAAISLAAGAAGAAQLDASAGGGLEYTTNAALTSQDEREELIGTALFNLSAAKDTGALRANAHASLLYRDYKNDTFGRQREFTFDGGARWLMQPDRFVWDVTNSYSRQPIDTLAADIPDNRQDVNVFSTGLDALLPLSVRQRLSFRPEYDRFYYEKTDYDNQQYILGATWSYQVTLPLALSLNTNLNRTEYEENDAYQDNTTVGYFLGIHGKGRRGSFVANLGFTDVLGDGIADQSGYLANLSWTHRPTRRSELSAYLGSELTNPSRVLAQVGIDPDLGIGADQQIDSSVFRAETARLSYNWQGARAGWRLNGYWDDRNYGGSSGRQRTTGTQLGVNRPLGPDLSASLQAAYERARLTETLFRYESYTLQGSLAYFISSKLKVTLTVSDTRRTSNLDSEEYSDLRVLTLFSYGSGASQGLNAPLPGTGF